ncbi:MAG: FHA domain-containing protein [Flavobacteriales bacterium]
MFAKTYVKIGSAQANDVVFSGASVLPFHAQLMQFSDGCVYINPSVAGAQVLLNGEQVLNTTQVLAQDQLQIDEFTLDLQSLFSWPIATTSSSADTATEADTAQPESKHGLSLQLIVIYAAVALLLILMAFYV